MAKISTGDFQKGMFIEFRGEPHQLVDFTFYNPGKGSAVVRSKLKSLKTGRVLDFTFKSGETTEEITVDTREMQYLYKMGEDYVFMNQVTYEQINLPKEMVGDFGKYIKEGEIYQILLMDSVPLSMRIPKKIKLLVTQADDSVKGNTLSGAKKEVTLETGVKVLAPLFIRDGDVLVIDPETGEYIERASQK